MQSQIEIAAAFVAVVDFLTLYFAYMGGHTMDWNAGKQARPAQSTNAVKNLERNAYLLSEPGMR